MELNTTSAAAHRNIHMHLLLSNGGLLYTLAVHTHSSTTRKWHVLKRVRDRRPTAAKSVRLSLPRPNLQSLAVRSPRARRNARRLRTAHALLDICHQERLGPQTSAVVDDKGTRANEQRGHLHRPSTEGTRKGGMGVYYVSPRRARSRYARRVRTRTEMRL